MLVSICKTVGVLLEDRSSRFRYELMVDVAANVVKLLKTGSLGLGPPGAKPKLSVSLTDERIRNVAFQIPLWRTGVRACC